MLSYFRYQAQLQKNLLYLAAIADAQPPQNPGSRPQVSYVPHVSITPPQSLLTVKFTQITISPNR